MRTLLVSGVMLAGAFGLFEYELGRGATEAEARTVVVNVLVMLALTYLFNCRSLERSMFQVGVCRNHWVSTGAAVMIVLQLAFTYLPVMNTLFHSAAIPGAAWIRIVAIALGGYTIVEVEKTIRRRVERRASVP